MKRFSMNSLAFKIWPPFELLCMPKNGFAQVGAVKKLLISLEIGLNLHSSQIYC